MKQYSRVNELPSGKAEGGVIKACMVLEGGAFRGVYTSGALDAMMLAGINTEATVGISAGAMNGINYAAGLIGRSGRINLKYRRDGRYVGLRPLVKDKGIIGFDFVFGEVCEDLPFDLAAFLASPRRLAVGCARLSDGALRYFEKDCGELYQAIRASASMPIVSRPVTVLGEDYLDGGCAEKIPLDWALEQGYEKIIVVRTRDRAYRRPEEGGLTRSLKRRMYRKHPAFLQGLLEEAARYNSLCERMEALEREGRLFMLCPSSPVTVGRLEKDMEKLGALYWQGYTDAEAALPELKAYLEA